MLGKRLIAGFHHCTNSPCWSKSATPKHILGVSLSQLLRQWRSWRTGSAAYALSLPLQRDSSSCTFATIRTSSFRFFWGCGEFSFVLSHCVLDFVVSGFSRFTVLTGGSTSVSDLDIWDNTGIAVRVSFTDSGISKGERGSSRDRLSSCLE